MFKADALMGALRLSIQEIEKLNFGRKNSRVLRLLRIELAAAEDVAAALLKEQSAVVNLVPQTRHAPSGLEVLLYRPKLKSQTLRRKILADRWFGSNSFFRSNYFTSGRSREPVWTGLRMSPAS